MKEALSFFLANFIGRNQKRCVQAIVACGEEAQWYREKMMELAVLVQTMPKTGETDGEGMNAIAQLHYFTAGADWYITEKDMEVEQHQAFGLADLFGDGGELGYISIVELLENHAELDLHWTPKALKECRTVAV